MTHNEQANECGYADVIIVGAGLIGASIALKLAQKTDLRIAVIEHSDQIKENPEKNLRVAALGGIGKGFLQGIGIWSKLTAQAKNPYDTMRIWDENSQGALTFDVNDLNLSHHKDDDAPSLGHIVDMNECIVLLHEALIKSQNINVFFGFKAEKIVSTTEQAIISDDKGNALTTKLMIAADGARSWVRKQLPISCSQFAYQQCAIVARIKTEGYHQNTAWQKFCDTGPLAILPLDNNESSIVWSIDKELAPKLMALSDIDFANKVSRLLESRLGKVTMLSKRQSFELMSQRVKQYCYQRVVLIGDAAHQIHPLAGQGANLGFKDAQCLANIIQDHRCVSKRDLRKYERQRKFDNEKTDLLMSLFYRAYTDSRPWWMAIRGLGMQTVNKSSKIKKMLAEQAIG